MLELLVAVDRSLEASFALRTACLFGTDSIRIQPIYVFDPPGRDLAFGAGWAAKSWKRETSRQAEGDIEDLVLAEKGRCQSIHDPVVLTGDPVAEAAGYFWTQAFDLLVVGAPFRGMGPLTLCRRFASAARREGRKLPLMVVRHLNDIGKIVALTDGSPPCESALELLRRINPYISGRISLVGTASGKSGESSSERLNLERGLAIFNEKEIEANGHTAGELGSQRLTAMLRKADLLVNPLQSNGPSHFPDELDENEIPSVLLYLDGG